MAWLKQGVIFTPDRGFAWMKSHAMLPTPLLLDDRIRVYYCARGTDGRSRPSYFDVSRDDPRRVLYVHEQTILDCGALGCFDDSGVLPGSVLRVGSDIHLYYVGYNVRVTVPYSNAIGVAVSHDGGHSFQRPFEGPVVDRNAREPYFCISPCVLHENGLWRMWYASGTGWITVNGKPESLYHIKYAESDDGIEWRRDNQSCIVPLHPQEANVRPTVLHREGLYRMWYCYRGSLDFRDGGDSYRLGYAESRDARHWTRRDAEAVLHGDVEEWDARMQAYPNVIDTGRGLYLFYNGNGFGQSGIGIARWD